MITLATPARFGQLPKLHVYVDETGDRGFSEASRAQSPFFAMTALLIPQEDEWVVKLTAGGLRALVHGAEPQRILKPIHWVEHFKAKRQDRRQHAAKALALMPNAMVIHVIAHKDTVNEDAGMRKDKGVFYNFTARLLLERIAFAAKEWPGGSRLAIVRLGTVKHMDHTTTADYLNYVRQTAGLTSYPIPWNFIKWPLTWESTQRDGIQLADIHAGILNSALSGDPQDRACAENLLLVRHQLRRAWNGTPLGRGVKIIGDDNFITGRVWWPEWRAG